MTLPALQTAQLWLRPLALEDSDDLHVAYGDPRCMEWWHHAPSGSPDETRQAVAMMLRQDAGHWAFGAHDSLTVLGHVGYVTALERDGHAGFGYALRRDAWGNGFASEAARAALDHGFRDVGIARAELWIHRDNQRSIRLASRLGCVRRSEVLLGYPRGPTPVVVYGVTAEAWRDGEEAPASHYSVDPILAVTDVAAAAEWWRTVLGFHTAFLHGSPPSFGQMLPDPPWTGSRGVQLSLRPQEKASRSTVFVSVRAVDEIAERAEGLGTTIVEPLGDRPWGVREITLADLDGNHVRVGTPS